MTARSDLFRDWCVQAWRCVLHATQVMAGLDLTGQFIGWGPQYPGVPVSWRQDMPWADAPRAALTESTRPAVTERVGVFTPLEWARLRVLRDRYQANRAALTGRESAQLHFVRWLHQTGRITG